MYSTGGGEPKEKGNQAQSFVAKCKSQKGPLIGTVLTIPSVPIAQLAGISAHDFILIDMEHAPQPMEVVTQMVHACVASSRGSVYPLIRVPSHGVEWIKWALDSGAAGEEEPLE